MTECRLSMLYYLIIHDFPPTEHAQPGLWRVTQRRNDLPVEPFYIHVLQRDKSIPLISLFSTASLFTTWTWVLWHYGVLALQELFNLYNTRRDWRLRRCCCKLIHVSAYILTLPYSPFPPSPCLAGYGAKDKSWCKAQGIRGTVYICIDLWVGAVAKCFLYPLYVSELL